MIAYISREFSRLFLFRGDSLACIAELLQTSDRDHYNAKKASLPCKHRLKYQDVYPPEVNADNLQLISKVML
eukprot:scaffold2428_cov24-Cyclotella_meneghiniana.AAC.2